MYCSPPVLMHCIQSLHSVMMIIMLKSYQHYRVTKCSKGRTLVRFWILDVCSDRQAVLSHSIHCSGAMQNLVAFALSGNPSLFPNTHVCRSISLTWVSLQKTITSPYTPSINSIPKTSLEHAKIILNGSLIFTPRLCIHGNI